MASSSCTQEPWGRYSASGGVYTLPNDGGGSDDPPQTYLYSFGGDTASDADGQGGVVLTNFRYSFATGCWEQLANSPTEIGYRATATHLAQYDPDHVYIFAGSDRNRVATNQFYRYSLLEDTWTELPLVASSSDAADVPGPRWKHAAVPISETQFMVTGGRDGALVRNDAWLYDAVDSTWTLLVTAGNNSTATTESTTRQNETVPMYRHGMAYDEQRNRLWMYGGLDDTLTRYNSELWYMELNDEASSSFDFHLEPVRSEEEDLPARLASHVMEYIPGVDALLLWGGTCSDNAEFYIYDIPMATWCHITPASRPDRRDAMLWSLDYPLLHMAQGDIICYNRQVLTIADVHVFNLTTVADFVSTNQSSWNLLYEPFNTRGTGDEPICDGSNAGNCQPSPFFMPDSDPLPSTTCSASLLERFRNPTMTNDNLSGGNHYFDNHASWLPRSCVFLVALSWWIHR